MNKSVLIVCLPKNPLTFQALLPRSDAARVAAGLRTAEFDVRIADLATLERVPRLISRKVLSLLDWPPAEPSEGVSLDFSERNFAGFYMEAVQSMVSEEIARVVPECVIYIADSKFELRASHALSGTLGGGLTQYVWYQGELRPLLKSETSEHRALADAFEIRGQTSAGYAPDVYPALREESKLRVFTIGDTVPVGDSVAGLFTIIEETTALQRHYNAHAFHFGRSLAGNQLYHLASDLVTRNARFRYSVDAAMIDYPSELPAMASASGCVAASFLIGSGSQRLIDEHFGYPFRVRLAEQTIREMGQSGAITCVDMSYPCAQDDFHTRDEAIRFVARAMPHAVRITAPRGSRSTAAEILWRPVERRRRHLERALVQLGVSPDLRPEDALLASLAGYGGRERQFLSYAGRALVCGNMDALATIVDSINVAASGHSERIIWRTLGTDRRMVGN